MRRNLSWTVFAAAAFVLVLPLLGAPQQADAGGDVDAQAAQDAARVPIEIPKNEAARRNPVAGQTASLESGGRLYASQCAMCHGADGTGKGDLALRLHMNVSDLTNAGTRQTKTDGEVFYVLSKGHGQMPGHERFSEEFRWNLVNHVQSLTK